MWLVESKRRVLTSLKLWMQMIDDTLPWKLATACFGSSIYGPRFSIGVETQHRQRTLPGMLTTHGERSRSVSQTDCLWLIQGSFWACERVDVAE